ncbi:ribonuclease H-like domain-containing protein [Tanacetum coccineum]
MHSPLKSHLDIALRVLKYLKLASRNDIGFSKRESSFDIIAFSDSDWAKCPDTRRSVSGYCVFVNGCLVSWKSKKQSTLSMSSSEAEYRSMASVTCEVMWIVKVMKDLYVENLIPASCIVTLMSSGLIKTVKVDSKENVIDLLTKINEGGRRINGGQRIKGERRINGGRIDPRMMQDMTEEADDEEFTYVLTDEWKEFFAKSEAKRRLAKKQAKKKGKA